MKIRSQKIIYAETIASKAKIRDKALKDDKIRKSFVKDLTKLNLVTLISLSQALSNR